MQSILKILGVAGLLMACTTQTEAATKYERLYVFGDSYSDSGAGYQDGNGPTAVVYLAKKMNIPFTNSQDPAANDKGINFAVTAASSGAGAGEKVGDLLLVVGMQNQVEDFVARVRAKKIKFSPEKTLFFIEGGLNDHEGPADATVKNLTKQIELLKSVGARHFTITRLPTKIPAFNDVGVKLNPAYQTMVSDLRKSLKVDIKLNRFGEYLDDILARPAEYGITNTTDRCAGRALFGEDTTPCASPDAYFFYHGDHPSTRVHSIVADKLFEEITASH